MLILGIYTGGHDANVAIFDEYRQLVVIQQERISRKKGDGGKVPIAAIEECFASIGANKSDIDAVALGKTKYPARFLTQSPESRKFGAQLRSLIRNEKHEWLSRELFRLGRNDVQNLFDGKLFLKSIGCRQDIPMHFYNHHEAHALPCLFHSSHEFSKDAMLIYTADGGGDQVHYSHRVFRSGAIETLYGGDEYALLRSRVDSVGLAYSYATSTLGYRPNRHEGKLTGLAAWGNPVVKDNISRHFSIDKAGQIRSDFASNDEMGKYLAELLSGCAPEDAAASIQIFLEETVLESVENLLNITGARQLGLSGGIHANVRLNQRLAEELPVDHVFIYPAMGDAGLAVGGILDFLLERDGIETWLENSWPLEHLYFGRNYHDLIDIRLSRARNVRKISGNPICIAGRELAKGRIVAIYTRAMEFGPRALGARSILASPADGSINESLNSRLARTEFMPFAPVVSEKDATRVFDITSCNRYAAKFMTITCGVKSVWRNRIPAVVHVDGTARPQIINRETNPLYFDILQEFKEQTGLPVLINTSFNAHEEPIINTPLECLKALKDRRVDAVVTENGYYVCTHATTGG